MCKHLRTFEATFGQKKEHWGSRIKIVLIKKLECIGGNFFRVLMESIMPALGCLRKSKSGQIDPTL